MSSELGTVYSCYTAITLLSWLGLGVLCILVAAPFGTVVLRHLRGTLSELTNQTLDEDDQRKLLRVLSEFDGAYEEWWDTRSRISGAYIDIEISFLPETSYSAVTQTVAEMRARIEREIGKSVVNFVISEGC